MSPKPPQSVSGRNDPFTVGNFRVEIQGIASASFCQVQGLEVSIDVVEYRAGDAKVNTEQKLPGLFKTSDVTLKRGLTRDLSLWNWVNTAINGSVNRSDVAITLLDATEQPVLVWRLRNAWPSKWVGPSLNATSSDVAMEELVLVHEGLEMVAP
jgi:phage tail-like protein